MDEIVVEGKLLEWGNSVGVRLRKADLERLGLGPGEELIVRIARSPKKVDLSELPRFRSGHRDTAERHDEFLGRARAERHARRTGRT